MDDLIKIITSIDRSKSFHDEIDNAPIDLENPILQEIFDTHILPAVSELEKNAKTAISRRKIEAILLIGASLASVFIVPLIDQVYGELLYILAFSTIGIFSGTMMLLASHPLKKTMYFFRENIYPRLFKYFNESFTYYPEVKLSLGTFRKFGLLTGHRSGFTEDHFSGRYNGVNFSYLEAVLYNGSMDKYNALNGPLEFRGVFMLFDIKTPFKGLIKGQTHNLIKYKFSFLRMLVDAVENAHLRRGLHRHKTDDTPFEETYEVYTNSAKSVEAVLPKKLREGFVELMKDFKHEDIEFCFYKNQLALKIHGPIDRFKSTDVENKYDAAAIFHRTLVELKTAIKVIETLNLSELNITPKEKEPPKS